MTDNVVVSIGGSILVPGGNDSEYILRLAAMLKEVSKDARLAVVCGGGKTARYYAGIAKELGGGVHRLNFPPTKNKLSLPTDSVVLISTFREM